MDAASIILGFFLAVLLQLIWGVWTIDCPTIQEQEESSKFNIGDTLYCLHKFPEGRLWGGEELLVSFVVAKIEVIKEFSIDGVKSYVKYEGAKIGTNYYGKKAEEDCALTKKELAINLMERGIILKG